MTYQDILLSPADLKEKLIVSPCQNAFILNSRKTIQSILNGKDSRILLIVGPCSIHNIEATLEYAKKLKKLSDEVDSAFFIVMRVYCEKPRTTEGWKGLLYDPDMNGSHNITKGLFQTRKLLLELSDLGIATASEFLDPSTAGYYQDLISWGCIGARTSESQTHRQLASGLDLPISFKNNTSGNVNIAVNGILSASLPHTFVGINENGKISKIQTKGNPDCHLTLRGSDSSPNYDPESIHLSLKCLEKKGLKKRLLVDCSHGNSNRQHQEQCTVFQSVMHQIIEGNQNIKGLILESELFAGNQPFSLNKDKLQYGVSVTDSCIDFETTANLIKWAFEKLKINETLQNETLPNKTAYICPN